MLLSVPMIPYGHMTGKLTIATWTQCGLVAANNLCSLDQRYNPFERRDAFRRQMVSCPQRNNKGHILRALKKKYYLTSKGVHGGQRVHVPLKV
jgi:hypothetical protein